MTRETVPRTTTTGPSTTPLTLSLRSFNGFPDNLDTYSMVSGLWTSMFAFGAFVGPSLAGILYDHFGFGYATLLVVVMHIVLVRNASGRDGPGRGGAGRGGTRLCLLCSHAADERSPVAHRCAVWDSERQR